MALTYQVKGTGERLELSFTLGEGAHKVFFKCMGSELNPNAEAFLGLLLPLGMKNNVQVHQASGPVSRHFLEGFEAAQDFYQKYKPSFQRLRVEGIEIIENARPAGDRVAALFSGGVDSFYTLLRHHPEITDLVFIHGFDILLNASARRRHTMEMVKAVADHLGLQVIEIETNWRMVINRLVSGEASHGAFLANIGHLLTPSIGKIYIASSAFSDSYLYGSHPKLDPLFSSDQLEVIHEGYEATRLEKIDFISEHEIAMQWLRVCLVDQFYSYNCCRCEKCLRTMIALRTLGKLERCKTFPVAFDLNRVATLDLRPKFIIDFVREHLHYLEEHQNDPELKRALQAALNDPEWKKSIYRTRFWIPDQLRRVTRRRFRNRW